ncbi:MAG TPA: alpha/beta hydrolase [Chitinophagales bacterium]|nr:alpha/beta hydrolase [Chitinophagales bacterium]
MLKKVIIILIVFIVVLYLLAAVSFQVFSQIVFRRNTEKRFKEKDIPYEKISFSHQGMMLEGVAAGADSLPLVMLVHGSPGSWRDFQDNLADKELTLKARLVAIDRPGYGASSGRAAVTSLQLQAAALSDYLKANYPGRKAIWVGHSYGGAVIARIAMDHPQVVSGIIFLAASLDPQLERKKWFNELASWKVIRWLLPQILVTSNREIIALKQELERMLPLWQTIAVPVTIIQGTADRLVSPGNAAFTQRVLTNTNQLEVQMIDRQGHLIPWQRAEVIRDAIEKLLAITHVNSGNN